MTQDLHARVLSRLAELRATAGAATPGPWRWAPLDMTPSGKLVLIGDGFEPVVKAAQADVWPSRHDADHIAAWSPAVVLRWLDWADDVAREHAICCGDRARYAWPMTPHRVYAGLAAALGLEAVS